MLRSTNEMKDSDSGFEVLKAKPKPQIDTYAEREEKRFKVNQKIKTMKKGLSSSSDENKNLLLEELPQILRLLRFEDLQDMLPIFNTFGDEPKDL
jgi:hypothetical protein